MLSARLSDPTQAQRVIEAYRHFMLPGGSHKRLDNFLSFLLSASTFTVREVDTKEAKPHPRVRRPKSVLVDQVRLWQKQRSCVTLAWDASYHVALPVLVSCCLPLFAARLPPRHS